MSPSKSKAQQRLMGAAKACKEGKGPCKGGAAKVAKSMSMKSLNEYAGTKQKGLPEKKRKKKK